MGEICGENGEVYLAIIVMVLTANGVEARAENGRLTYFRQDETPIIVPVKDVVRRNMVHYISRTSGVSVASFYGASQPALSAV